MSNLIKIKIFLSTGNHPYKIKIHPTETIKSVLKLFTDQICPMIKNKIQNVCYSGQQLDINKTFQDYNISTNSNILLIICDQNKKSHQNFTINQGYIIGVFDIPKGVENSNIRIINSYEAVQREKKFQQQQNQIQMTTQQQTTANNQTNNNFEFLQENRNEKEIRKCVIEIEDISGMNNNGNPMYNQMGNFPQTGGQTSQAGHKISFSSVYKFQKAGKFKVKYSFNNTNLVNISYLFYNVRYLISVDFSNFNSENITNMSHLFDCDCDLNYGGNINFNLKNISLSGLNTRNVTNMEEMFRGCGGLTSLNLSNFRTDKVNNMKSMFSFCSNLTNLNVSSFNTKNVTNMKCMFYGCGQLKQLDLSNFNTEKVTNMQSMFYGCGQLTQLDLSNFNTKNVNTMKAMFYNCSSLTNLNLFSFTIKVGADISYLFTNCQSLANLDLSNFVSPNNLNIQYGIFHMCQNLDISNIICYDNKLLDVFSNDKINTNNTNNNYFRSNLNYYFNETDY